MWSRSLIAASSGAALAAGDAFATDSGRVGLLAREAADALAAAPAASPAGSVAFVGAVLLAALVASLLGTWLGLKSRAVARIRERNGWRELSYRFRAPGPLRADGNLLERMAGVLDDLEELGRRIKDVPLPVAAGVPGTPAAMPRGEPAPVRFRRSAGTEGVRVRWSPPEAAPALPAAPEPPRPLPRRVEPAPAEEPGRSRAAAYREARRLLRGGHDRDVVRERTGLKLAEIDLLRCAPGDAP